MSCPSFCNDFSKTLHYVSPAHGGWGVIKIAALVPESKLLFVAPMACGRHGALGGIEAGIKDRVHYLYLEEADIVSGGYEDQIYWAVEELFKQIEKPKVLFVFVACIDDMLGTDNFTIIKNLSEMYPDVTFRTCHMNPVSMDTATPPGVFLVRAMFSLLENEDKAKLPAGKKILLTIGNNFAIDRSCELFSILEKKGIELKHISECKDYEEFKQLAGSTLNLVIRPVAKAACLGMENKIHVPYMLSYVTYDPEEIKAFYSELAERLGFTAFDISGEYQKAINALKHLKEVLGDMPVAIDYQAVLKPFTLAKVLLQYGINVSFVAVNELSELEKNAREWVEENHPETQRVNALHPDLVLYKLRGQKCVCVGFDCGYMTMSEHTVNLWEDEGLFGFDGVVRLAGMIEESYAKTQDLWEGIREAKLVI